MWVGNREEQPSPPWPWLEQNPIRRTTPPPLAPSFLSPLAPPSNWRQPLASTAGVATERDASTSPHDSLLDIVMYTLMYLPPTDEVEAPEAIRSRMQPQPRRPPLSSSQWMQPQLPLQAPEAIQPRRPPLSSSHWMQPQLPFPDLPLATGEESTPLTSRRRRRRGGRRRRWREEVPDPGRHFTIADVFASLPELPKAAKAA
mmetsp:Transcript_70347/g.155544  ORF Transcript_70347/g.155544 Transcript_70347/m.155544 type:complete len:201 (-) Transcript_70347:68-670(-)